jgi:hypothetical protein
MGPFHHTEAEKIEGGGSGGFDLSLFGRPSDTIIFLKDPMQCF